MAAFATIVLSELLTLLKTYKADEAILTIDATAAAVSCFVSNYDIKQFP